MSKNRSNVKKKGNISILYSLESPINTELPRHILYTIINFGVGSERVEKRMAETRKLQHLLLIAVMLLFITNIAMASNVATGTAGDVTGGMHSC